MKQVTLAVDGMHCGHCVHAVREALAAIPGVEVKDVKVGSVAVDLDEAKAGIAALLEAVEDAGYRAQEA